MSEPGPEGIRAVESWFDATGRARLKFPTGWSDAAHFVARRIAS